MLLRMLWRFLRGYVEVRCDGGLFARFFDRMLKENLGVFKVKVAGNTARFCMYISDYNAVRAIAKKSQCRVRVERKHGLYFAYHKVNHKAALAAGFAVFFAVIYLLGNIVFTIEIKGPSTIAKNTLISSLEANGLKVGMWRGDVDVKRVEQGVLLDNERLSWIAVNLSFGVATIEVKDKIVEPPSPESGDGLIAKRDAKIKSIEIVAGEALVKPGEVVSKGQQLAIPSQFAIDGSWTTKVEAHILGYTEYTCTFTVSKNHVFREPTGNTFERKSLQFGETVLPLPGKQNSYQYFDVDTYITSPRLFSVELPFRIVTQEYVEVEQTSRRLNEQEAKMMIAQYQADFEQKELSQCEILSRESVFYDDGAAYVCTIQYLCLEDIGIYTDS